MDIIKKLDDIQDEIDDLCALDRNRFNAFHARIDGIKYIIDKLIDEVLVEKSIKDELKAELKEL